MSIDKHVVLTLERSSNRHWSMLGGARAMGIPTEKICFVKGHDNKEFDDDMEDIAEAAEVDGFPHVKYFAKGLKNEAVSQSASGVCQAWNFSRILRYIAFSNETHLITWDDRMITIPFSWLDKIIDELEIRKEDFYLFQLRVRMGDSELIENERILKCHPELIGDITEYDKLFIDDFDEFDSKLKEKWKDEFRQFKESQYKDYGLLETPEKYINKYIQRNMVGYDESMVISPKGAAWLLSEALNMKDLDPNDDVEGEPYWFTAACRRICFDAWIGLDLVNDPLKKALKEGKGIYCPKRIGYKYIEDWMPMGSDVEWANKNHERFENFRNISTKVDFLDIP